MHTLFIALPAAVIGAGLTMLALVSPVHGVAPSPEPVCRLSDAQPISLSPLAGRGPG